MAPSNYKIIKAVVICMVIISVVLISHAIYLDKTEAEFSCSTNISHVNEVTNVKIYTNAHFIFGRDGKGIVTLDGEATDGANVYQLSRTISLGYEYYARNVYFIKEKIPAINIKDSIPASIFEGVFFSTNYFYISKVKGFNNVYLIFSRVAPISLCVAS